jgi:chromosome segregation ATPase
MSIDYDVLSTDIAKAAERIEAITAHLDTVISNSGKSEDCVKKNEKTEDDTKTVKNDKTDEEKDKKIAEMTATIANLQEKITNLEKTLSAKNEQKEEPTTNTSDEPVKKDEPAKNEDDPKSAKADDKSVKNELTASFEELLAQSAGQEIHSVLSDLVATKRQNTKQLIETIVANCKDVYTQDELAKKPEAELVKLATFLSKQSRTPIMEETVFGRDLTVENEEHSVLDIPATTFSK